MSLESIEHGAVERPSGVLVGSVIPFNKLKERYEGPTVDSWLEKSIALAKAEGVVLITPKEMAKLAQTEDICTRWGQRFAKFDAERKKEVDDYNAALANGDVPPVELRTAAETFKQRDRIEAEWHLHGVKRCADCRPIYDAIWTRIVPVALKLADILEKQEVEFFAGQGVRDWKPLSGIAVREAVETRSNKPYTWHSPPPSPGTVMASLCLSIERPAK